MWARTKRWKQYIDGKQTLKQLGEKHGCSHVTIRRKLDAVMVADQAIAPRPSVFITDTTFWDAGMACVSSVRTTSSGMYGGMRSGPAAHGSLPLRQSDTRRARVAFSLWRLSTAARLLHCVQGHAGANVSVPPDQAGDQISHPPSKTEAGKESPDTHPDAHEDRRSNLHCGAQDMACDMG